MADIKVVKREILAVTIDDLLDDPGPVENGNGYSVLRRQLVLEAGATFGASKLRGDA